MNIDKKAIVHNGLLTIGVLILIPVVALGGIWLRTQFTEGPSVIFSGGPLDSGELVTDWEPNWDFVNEVRTFEFQLLNPPRSRTLWIVEVDGTLYLNSNYMGGLRERYWKRWPSQAEQDGRSVMRIRGKRYPTMVTRITSGPIIDDVAEAFTRKYGVEMTREEIEQETLWFFEISPREVTGGAS